MGQTTVAVAGNTAVTHGFLEPRALAASVLRRTDAVWKISLFVAAAATVASEPRGELHAFPFYALLIVALALLGIVRPWPWLSRCLAVVPFLALAAALPFAAGAPGVSAADWAASIVLRGLAAAALLSLLAETTEFAEIIQALKRMRVPAVWTASLALAYRYLFLLADEWTRLSEARVCRAPGLTGPASAGVMSQQLGLVFVRAWERGERIHGAMLTRGFDGSWPVAAQPPGSRAGALWCLVFLLGFLALRVAA